MSDSRIEFEVLWYSGGPEHAPNRCIGRDYIKRHDLDAAITWACNRLKANRGENAQLARGFYVQLSRKDR